MNHKKHIKLATGIGMAAGGLLVGVAALYTEVITSVVARRRNAFTDGIVAATQGGGGGIDPTIRDKARALREIPMEQVSIRSHDGYVLRARWYPAENAERTVILAHGWHGAWNTDFSLSAPLLHNRGCNLLLIDQRCHGDSGGDLISYGIRERYDILSWLDYLTEQGIGLPVYLCGISMGASTVLMTAELPVADRVSGIIADCGYSTPDEIVSLALRNAVGCMTAPTLAAVNHLP